MSHFIKRLHDCILMLLQAVLGQRFPRYIITTHNIYNAHLTPQTKPGKARRKNNSSTILCPKSYNMSWVRAKNPISISACAIFHLLIVTEVRRIYYEDGQERTGKLGNVYFRHCRTDCIKRNSSCSHENLSQWTDCIIDKVFKNIEIVKFITTALKSILNLVKLQSLVAKCCKM